MTRYVHLTLFLLFTTTTVTAQSCDLTLQADTSGSQKAVVGGGTCTWTINSSGSSEMVTLNFQNVNLTQHPSCDVTNSIVVHDGDSSGAILGLVCGNYTSTFQSSGNVLTVVYPAAEVTDTNAFELQYYKSDLCYGQSVFAVSTTEYNIFSYGYPDGPSRSFTCRWKVEAPKGQQVRVSIETAGNVSTSCRHVQVKFLDENGKDDVTWCPGKINVYQSWSESASMMLRISSERSVRLKYRTLEGPTCRGDNLNATQEEQFLMTPGYPSPFPSYLECRWTIASPNPRSGAIRIDILEMDLDTEGCMTDVIRVYDGATSAKKLVGTACEGPRSFYVYGISAKIEFRSLRENNTKQGFKLKYYYTTAEPCGGGLVANSTMQNVTSPGYPTNFPNSVRCSWTISAENPQGHVIVSFLEVELYRLIEADVVKVYDGNSTSGYLVGRVLGTEKPTFSSQEASLTVVFTTDIYGQFTLNKPGFVFGYEETQDTPPVHRLAEIKLSGSSTMLSPRFPDGKVKDMNATWTVRSKYASYEVLLSFVEVDVGDAGDCNNNYIMVYQGNTSSSEFSKICGNETGKFVSRDKELSVVLRTDSNLAKRGFKAEYSRPTYGTLKGCSGDTAEKTALLIDSNDLYSPMYPDIYPNMMNCSTLVKSIFDDHYIQLEVTEMNMPHPEDTGCTRDYVEFFDGPSSASPSLGRACGQTLLKVQSIGNEVLVMFISDSNVGDKGYRIKYKDNREETPYTMPVGLIVGITFACIGIVVVAVVCLICKHGRKADPSVLQSQCQQ
ncbi:scavenger receptor cysteine-rich domain-containing protein DMBT1-like isoform X2 [Haliotis cracherodii]|uniref:scavenger receptor cysteine-rich domain-containing protein DMBT1-like isoform X2 n=1 Tax=Haliotis cracherodii TaxID=6455 RepID=UPI0039EC68D0